MKRVFELRGHVSAAVVFALICAVGVMPLRAQSGGSITGTVLDQAGKAIQGSGITVKNEVGSASGNANSDAEGKFSITGLAAGIYTVETSSPGFALNTRRSVDVSAGGSQDLAITLYVDAISQSVTVQDSVSLAADLAPIGAPLDTSVATTVISNAVITNFMAPVADFAEVIQQAPGAFSTNPNGIGLGQGKSFFRSFPDGDYTMKFDGIPFEDTNTPTHHSWASFPSQWISSVDFDRSPGEASDFGPTNFGGSINLKSPELQADPDIRGTFSYGSFNTKLYSLDAESGQFGPGKKDAVLANINFLTSDGYQTYNNQNRGAGYGKFQHRFSDKTSLSLYGGVVDIRNNTPDTTSPRRDQVAAYGDNFLMTDTPLCPASTRIPACPVGTPDPYYYGYEHYHVQTDFEYAAFQSDLGNGWHFDNKLYTTRYWNKQFLVKNFAMNTTTAKPSGVDKLNGYRHAGDTAILSWESKWGIFRTGAWYDWAYTDRYQIPSNPVTQVNQPLPNFHEHFVTQSFQPFTEFEWHPLRKLVITAGIKAADYKMSLNQFQDNGNGGSGVGCLGGTASTYPSTGGIWAGAPSCIGGAAFVSHTKNWNNWLPTLNGRYRIWRTWSAYADFGEGSIIPPSAAFDVPGGNVLAPLNPTLAKTYQGGTIMQFNRFTFDMDVYYVHFANPYTSYYDPNLAQTFFVATGPSNTSGFESEGSFVVGHGVSIYANYTAGYAKYQSGPNYPNGGLWVANTPTNIEGVSVLYQHRNWDLGMTYKRVGQYWQDNKTLNYTVNGVTAAWPVNQAVLIQPWDLLNFFANYTIKNSSHFRGTKIQFAANNLADNHSLVGLTPGVSPTSGAHYVVSPSDLLNLLPGRSFSITITGGYAPKR
jgi:iron complex outermembrane recepter protein